MEHPRIIILTSILIFLHGVSATTFTKLVGVRKGETASGIRDVKSYLHRFGYLNKLSLSTNEVTKDLFDDDLEHALLTYQKFFKLDKTGILDNATVSMMSQPRCGCPDIHMQIGKNMSDDHFKRHYVINKGRFRRTKSPLYYEFRGGIRSSLKIAIIQAFYEWEPHVHLKFFNTVDPKRYAPDIIIQFFRREHGDGLPFDGQGGFLAHAAVGQGSMFHFDADENWQVGAISDAHDITSVALHEIGHLLGLEHSTVASAIMYPTIHAGTVRKIDADDVAGINDLYTVQNHKLFL